MNPKDKTTEKMEAFKYLHSATVPDETTLDAMSKEEVEQFLTDAGCDLKTLRARIADRKKKFAGRYALMLARQRRLASKAEPAPEPAVPDTKEGIIAYFEQHFGANLPLAARNFKSADYSELRRLYLDLVGGKGAGPDAE